MSSAFDSSTNMALTIPCSPLGSLFTGYPTKAPGLTLWGSSYHLGSRAAEPTIHEHPVSPGSPGNESSKSPESSALVPMHSPAFHAAPSSIPYRLYPMNQPHGFLPASGSIHAALFPRDLCPAFPAMPPVFSSGLPIMPRASFYTRPSMKPCSSSRQGSISPRDLNASLDEPKNCHICGKSYARLSTLRLHLRTHSGVKPYQCMVCLKSFTQAANLTAHFRIHSGEKPFRCRVCGRQFSQSSSVTTHMRTHNGERPYSCKVCNKAFADSSTLTKHVRTHTGEKPYQCEICLQRFSQSGNMNRHKRIHEM